MHYPFLAAESIDIAGALIELGAAVVGLSALARLASRWGFSAIPLFLVAGLAFGNGGLLPLNFSESFIHFGAEIGVILLLFMLGLEYTSTELGASLRTGLPSGAVDLLLNFTPGLIAGLVLGWQIPAAILLGGVTYISSSGIVAKILAEFGWKSNPEIPAILSILVLEDLAMAVFLPAVAVLLVGQSFEAALIGVAVALAAAGALLFIALRYGMALSRFVAHHSDEIVILTIFGLVLLVAGVAQAFQVSAAIGAFLVGVAVSGPIVEQTHRLLSPLRDLFAAVFFFFFGLQVDPSTLPPVLGLAVGLGLVTTITKMISGWYAARRDGVDVAGRLRAGAALSARGEFSIVIAGLGVTAGIEPLLGPLSAAYVLFLAVLGPLLARVIVPVWVRMGKRQPGSEAA
jgi:CPA2 family monovalent cation:H+ antiporter-2